ncbi:MAG: hypothetical protein H7338_09375 [Candidatus Sericytochromatia bacterium]|nr:hypothetical protein [Candidatus Sericytochromatia bacterium]
MKLIATLALLASLSFGAVIGAGAAEAKPAKQYVGSSAKLSKDPTFQGGQIGQVAFTTVKPAKTFDIQAASLTFPKGQVAQNWWGRAFFPTNLKEVAGTFKKQRTKLVLTAYLTGAGKPQVIVSKKLDKKWEKWQWFTFDGKNKNLAKAFANLPAGTHNANIVFKLISTDGKRKGADVERIMLAGSPVTINVQ